MNNYMEREQKPIVKNESEGKEVEMREYARITTDDFFNNFQEENEENVEKENFGPVYLNLTNGTIKLVTSTEETLGKEYAKKLAGRISYVLNFWLLLAKEDNVKDLGIKSGATKWLSEYLAPNQKVNLEY